MDSVSNDDEFWSVAMFPPTDTSAELSENIRCCDDDDDDEDEDMISTIQSFTILPPEGDDDTPQQQQQHNPLILNLHMNCNDGILSDVAGIPWDAALLLSGFLYGTWEGRRLCYDACYFKKDDDGVGLRNDYDDDRGGILELGSGLGIVGLVAAAAASSFHCVGQDGRDRGVESYGGNDDDNNTDHETSAFASNDCNKVKRLRHSRSMNRRVVLTDRNNQGILSDLRRNVHANLDRVAEAVSSCDSPNNSSNNNNDPTIQSTTVGDLSISVEPCDWMDLSSSLQIDTNIMSVNAHKHIQTFDKNNNFPHGPFNLILGSALVYLPEHAAACADTLFYYLTPSFTDDNDSDHLPKRQHLQQQQAIILQLPDRAGFSTHFLPRCRELGLTVSCQPLDEGMVERVQRGWNRRIPSASDYRLYFIAFKEYS